jgi:enoyl-CoA hydratase
MPEAAPTSYDLTDGLATISLDDGKANVFSNASLEALENHLDQAEADGARAMLIVGRPGRFSAGFDLAEMTSSTESMRSLVIRGARWWMRLYGMGLPTVAACTGHALAGGALTLLSCDLRIGAAARLRSGTGPRPTVHHRLHRIHDGRPGLRRHRGRRGRLPRPRGA